MLILAQDKKSAINLDTCHGITTGSSGAGEFIIKAVVDANVVPMKGVLLGQYKTEEIACAVLEEILDTYASYLKCEGGPAMIRGGMNIQPYVFNHPKVYRMPPYEHDPQKEKARKGK